MWLHVFGRLKPGVSLERAQANANVVFSRGWPPTTDRWPTQAARKRFLDQRLALRAGRDRRVDAAQRLRRAAAGAARRGRARAAHRLLEPRQPAAGADDGAEPRDGGAPGARRKPRPPDSTAPHREPVPRGARRPRRGWRRRSYCANGLLRLVSDTAIALPAALDLRAARLRLRADAAVGPRPRAAAGACASRRPRPRPGCANRAAASPDPRRGCASARPIVVGQLALSLPLLVGAGLLVRTLLNLQHVDLGYAKDDLLTLRVDARAAELRSGRARRWPSRRCSARIRAIPGVRTATYSNNGLFGGCDNGDQINVEGYTRDREGRQRIALRPGRARLLLDARRSRAARPRDHGTGSAGRPRRVRHQRDVREDSSSRGAIRSACTSRRSTPTSGTPTKSSASSATRGRTGCAARSSTASTRRRRSRPPASMR